VVRSLARSSDHLYRRTLMSTNNSLVLSAVLMALLVACLTVNVYFYPSEEVDLTAKEIIEDIRGSAIPEDEEDKEDNGYGDASPGEWLLVEIAYAGEEETSVSNPAIESLKVTLKERSKTLGPYFSAGAIGEGNDGFVVIRNASAVSMKDRAKLNGIVKEENADRKALYKEVAEELAVKDEDLPKVQKSFANQWRQTVRKGWWFQDDLGEWNQF
jgi:uncharacterized protein YdbL (DUF1318 family)